MILNTEVTYSGLVTQSDSEKHGVKLFTFNAFLSTYSLTQRSHLTANHTDCFSVTDNPITCHDDQPLVAILLEQAIRDETIIDLIKQAVFNGDKDEVFKLAQELTS